MHNETAPQSAVENAAADDVGLAFALIAAVLGIALVLALLIAGAIVAAVLLDKSANKVRAAPRLSEAREVRRRKQSVLMRKEARELVGRPERRVVSCTVKSSVARETISPLDGLTTVAEAPPPLPVRSSTHSVAAMGAGDRSSFSL
jgi:hypothetical protein